MTDCNTKLTVGILYSCLDKPKKGISDSKAVIINFDDIDKSASTTDGSKVTDLVLKAGTVGVSLEWYKDLASGDSAFAPSQEDIDGFIHKFLCRMGTSSVNHAERANEISKGRFIVVYESKYKGLLSVDAFKIRGWENGVTLLEMVENSKENSGSLLFTLSTEEGDVEEYPYHTFLETDYATSKATFDTLFAPVV